MSSSKSPQGHLADPSGDRIQHLLSSLDFLTEGELCALCGITLSTAEAWRKRHKGPAYALAGNRILYPREGVKRFLESQVRQLQVPPPKSLL